MSILQKLLGKKPPVNPGTTVPPAAPKPTIAASASTGSGNAFTQLFGASNGTSNSNGSSVLPGKRPTATPTIASLLGPKPTYSSRDFEEQEEKTSRLAKRVFQFSIVCALVAYGYFYTQLDSGFSMFSSQLGPNIATQFESSNAELQKTQTDLNVIRFRMIRLMLDEINTQIDARTAQKNILLSPTSTDSTKASAQDSLGKITTDLKANLVAVQKLVAVPFGVDTFSRVPILPSEREANFTAMLKTELTKQRAALGGNVSANKDELRSIDGVVQLVDNTAFQSTMRSKDFGKITDDELDAVLAQIRAEGTDQLSAIEKIKSQRMNWARIISDINTVTRKADLYYGQGLFKTVGGFLFSSYRFDSKTKRISITGLTKTSDSKTFSFIAKLVDSIEKSPEFKDIDFRSFSKTLGEDGDYSSSINLDFALQNGPDDRDDINFDTK